MVQGSFFHQAPSVVRSICSRKFLSCLARVCGSPFLGKVSHSSSTKGRKKTSPPGKETSACHSCGANAFLIGGAVPENFKWRVSAHENKWHKDGTNSGLPYSNHMHPYAAFNISCWFVAWPVPRTLRNPWWYNLHKPIRIGWTNPVHPRIKSWAAHLRRKTSFAVEAGRNRVVHALVDRFRRAPGVISAAVPGH